MANEDIPEELQKKIHDAHASVSGFEKNKRRDHLEKVLGETFPESQLGLHERVEVVIKLMKDLENDEIPSENFSAAVVRGIKLTRLNEVFKSFDLDTDGLITRDEIKKGMRRDNPHITDEEAEQIIKEMGDENKDGKIDFREFSKKYI